MLFSPFLLAEASSSAFGIDPVYISWQLGSFLIFALILYFFAIKPILATMDERNAKIEEGLQFSEDIKVKLAEAEKQYADRLAAAADEAAHIAKEAHARAKSLEEKASQDAIAKANDILRRAEEQIARDRTQMLAELRGEVSRLVVATTEKILSHEISSEENARFNAAAAREISSQN